MEENSLLYVTTLPGLVAIGSGDKIFLIYHVISCDHEFNGLCDLMDWIFL